MTSHNNQKSSQSSARKLAECLPFIVQMKDAELKRIEIDPQGEFHKLSDAKETVAVMHRIKSVFRVKGYGCYALHDFLWIVPFVHQGVHVPDFERAKAVLPDFKSELLGEAFPDDKPKKSARVKLTKPNIGAWLVIGFVVVLLAHLF